MLPAKMKSIKKFSAISAKLLMSLLLTFLLIEIGLRLFPGFIPLDLLVLFSDEPKAQIARRRGLPTKKWDTVLLERDDGGPDLRIFRPFTTVTWPIEENGTISTVEMDENGFCNPPENSYQLPAIDLITLGDSFTACHAVDPPETWTSQLSSLTGMSAYNLGKGGTGIHDQIQILKQFGLPKSPKIVMINVYEGNDFRDAANYYYHLLGQSSITPNSQQVPTPTSGPFSLLSSSYKFIGEDILKRYSYAVNLTLATAEFLQTSNFGPAASANADNAPSEGQESAGHSDRSDSNEPNFRYRLIFSEQTIIPFNLDNIDTDEVEYATRLLNEEIDPGVFWSIGLALGAFVELSQEHNFVPIVTYTPSAHNAYADMADFDHKALNELMPWFSREQRQFLTAKGQELGYIFIDLTPALRAAAASNGPANLLYYRYDLHLTPAGHTVVARSIHEALQDLSMIP
jgi:hypothetical protein